MDKHINIDTYLKQMMALCNLMDKTGDYSMPIYITHEMARDFCEIFSEVKEIIELYEK